MSAEIYYSETHPRSLLVIATLNYLDIKFSAKKLDMDKGEHTTAAMKKISPDGLLPALKDGDLCLSRAQAIAKYMISEETKGTDFYPDDDLKTRIKIDAFCDYDSMDLRPALAELVMYYSKQDEMADQKGRILDTWQKVIKFLNGMVTRVEGKFFLGNHPTLADFSVFSSVFEAVHRCNYDFDGFPEVKQWYDNVEAIDQVKKMHKSDEIT